MSTESEALEAAIELLEVHLMRYPSHQVEQAFELILSTLREHATARATGTVVQEKKCRCGSSHFRPGFLCAPCELAASADRGVA